MKIHEETLSLGERINLFLARNWRLALVIFIIVVVAMSGILIFEKIYEGRLNSSAILAEDIQDSFEEWMRELPEDRNSDEVMSLIDQALNEYPRLFAAQRALFTRALIAVEQEQWEDASKDFIKLAETWEKSYLAPISLFNAASVMEELGDIEDAKRAYSEIIDSYSTTSADVPEALFNLGRIAEVEDDIDTAIENYKQIAVLFPDSQWTNLSKSRILAIEAGKN